MVQDFQGYFADELVRNVVARRSRGVPGLGPVAEIARPAPLAEGQPHGPRLAFENPLPEGRFGRVEQLAAVKADRRPHSRRRSRAGINRLGRAAELLGSQADLAHRRVQRGDDSSVGRRFGHHRGATRHERQRGSRKDAKTQRNGRKRQKKPQRDTDEHGWSARRLLSVSQIFIFTSCCQCIAFPLFLLSFFCP